MAASQTAIEIRQLFQLAEFEEVLALQKSIWGFEDIELLPLRFLVVVSKVGGHVFGAYDCGAGFQPATPGGPQDRPTGRMIGFCFAIPGIKSDGRPYLHSHMLGVMPDYRNHSVGRSLKLQQREDALARGIQVIEWTFDPLELKNAFLNIEKLGAIVRRYNVNQYGTTSSPLHGGLPTDRCIAEWWIATPRAAGQRTHGVIAERISYPADIARIRAEEPERAREIQSANARKFLDAFAQGLAVTGFERSETTGTYLLEPWQ